MPMDVHIDDLYELVCEYDFIGQKALNVYFYRTGALFLTTLPTNAEVLVEGWNTQILPDILAAQPAGVTAIRVSARNLYDPADAFSLDISEVGLIAGGDNLGSFEALAFKENGDTHAVRNGAKRLCGVTEAEQTNGVLTGTDVLAGVATAASAMEKAVQVGLLIMDDVFFPVLVKRVRSGVKGAYTYKLPEVRGEGVWSNIISVLFDVLVSSQVSRKIGRGM